MPDTVETMEPEDGRKLTGNTGNALERSLFLPVYEGDLNKAEQDVAIYLDGEEAVAWWHRNVARTQYGLPGWKRGKVYPDFIFGTQGSGGSKRITVLETKGDHLGQNLDTNYKTELLRFLSDNFAWDTAVPAGELELIKNTGETVRCALVLMSEWPTARAKLIN